MNAKGGIDPHLARHILDRMGSTGQPPERGALFVNVGTGELLEVLLEEYLRPMRASGRNAAFKLVQATFGGGKSQFLQCLRELAWGEGFATAVIGLSPQECPFDKPVKIYREVAGRIELPPGELAEETARGLDVVLRQIAETRIAEYGAQAFESWLNEEFARANVESRSFRRAVCCFLEAVLRQAADEEELLGDYLMGATVGLPELARWRLREPLEDATAFRWLRSLTQCLAALAQPGVVLMFDEMDRNMSLPRKRRQAIGDNLRQMIDYCGQSLLPGVLWCYAVPPEFMREIVPEYPALAQRLKGATRFSALSRLQPIIDLDHLPLGATALMKAIGQKLLQLLEIAHEARLDRTIQEENIDALARELGDFSHESGTRRQFVKAVVTLLENQRLEGQRRLDASEISALAGRASFGDADFDEEPDSLADETEF